MYGLGLKKHNMELRTDTKTIINSLCAFATGTHASMEYAAPQRLGLLLALTVLGSINLPYMQDRRP